MASSKTVLIFSYAIKKAISMSICPTAFDDRLHLFCRKNIYYCCFKLNPHSDNIFLTHSWTVKSGFIRIIFKTINFFCRFNCVKYILQRYSKQYLFFEVISLLISKLPKFVPYSELLFMHSNSQIKTLTTAKHKYK
jgi:hypothetical protein